MKESRMSCSTDRNLPKTNYKIGSFLGQGTFASVYLCYLESTPYAVKFINKDRALKLGGLREKDIIREITLHTYSSNHKNIVSCFEYDVNDKWVWMAMQPAFGGDLFSKIEPDVGVPEDIGHMYFKQLIGAVEYMHSKGIAHRDIKPENILLDSNGNLLLADFGFAMLYRHRGQTRTTNQVCGSPPYAAPEILAQQGQYAPAPTDIWSCGVVLFVLLTGCTPWEWATANDPDYRNYRIRKSGIRDVSPWSSIGSEAFSLIRKLLDPKPQTRFSCCYIRLHPWFKKPNSRLTPGGRCNDSLKLAEDLLLRMKIDIKQPSLSMRKMKRPQMISNSQPTEVHARQIFATSMNSQPIDYRSNRQMTAFNDRMSQMSQGGISQMSQLQFQHDQLRSLPETLTQRVQRFNEICPPETINRFYAMASIELVKSRLFSALQTQSIPTSNLFTDLQEADNYTVEISKRDRRRCPLSGKICCIVWPDYGDQFIEVAFDRSRGDPLEWRHLFKEIVKEFKDIIYTGDI
ncbi:kinase-like domain-containing protein [Lipomyces oligophaga]|uniref:kinase-like domain-containing protein n=1 Tax=Lipomyces oligophaga TaxID=45792 RepID=UPI0034CD52B4